MLCLFQVDRAGVWWWRCPLPRPRFCVFGISRYSIIKIGATDLFPNAGESTGFTTLVHRLHNPVDSRIPSDLETRCMRQGNGMDVIERHAIHRFVVRIYQYDLVVLVDAILINPVRIQDSEVSASPADSFFCSTAQPSLILQVVDTLTHRFAICSTCNARTSSENVYGKPVIILTHPSAQAFCGFHASRECGR